MTNRTEAAALILSIVSANGNMDADDLDSEMLAEAIAAELVVSVRGYIYPATSRHTR